MWTFLWLKDAGVEPRSNSTPVSGRRGGDGKEGKTHTRKNPLPLHTFYYCSIITDQMIKSNAKNGL